MSDDRIQQGLEAYSDHLQHTTAPAPAREIRHRAARRRRNRAAGAAFVAVLIAAGGLGVLVNRGPERPDHPVAPASPSPSPSSSAPVTSKTRTSTVTSNVKQLRNLGVDLNVGVLIDVADDGVDRWMQIGAGDVVDFTGSVKDPSTEMMLSPAPVSGTNRVVIVPPARPGMCVAATPEVTLTLRTCQDGAGAQTWRVVPAGDSGQFELEGEYGILEVEGSLVADGGRTGMQTIRFTD
ncbi:hypothetical protein GCM10010435_26430 [Winogradskya consettensis]|uniref:Uncharacterized protein n=1 Tax=Winogradskya consettensis TaxID=113560 RepID=A0A919SAP3_9ACTN|nr:hypothetical protein [Actinoplanes consettensis]GIM68093.1 hypothetical protein Aco04nite_09220 [Actinoplanes consettensis]